MTKSAEKKKGLSGRNENGKHRGKRIWILLTVLFVINGEKAYAQPMSLESESTVVYTEADKSSDPVGNLIRGNTFELAERVSAGDGSVWYRVTLPNGVKGYVSGEIEAIAQEAEGDAGAAGTDGTQEQTSENAGGENAGSGNENGENSTERNGTEENSEENSTDSEESNTDGNRDSGDAGTNGENGTGQNDDADQNDTGENAVSEEEETAGGMEDTQAAWMDGVSVSKKYEMQNAGSRIVTGKEAGTEDRQQMEEEKSGLWKRKINKSAAAAAGVAVLSVLLIKLSLERLKRDFCGGAGHPRKTCPDRKKVRRRKKARQTRATKQKHANGEGAREASKEEKKWKSSNTPQ